MEPRPLTGKRIKADYTPSNYTPTAVGVETTDKVSAHLKGIDEAIDPANHAILRQLIHFIDNGPAEGFATGAYRENTGSQVYPTAITWYDKSGVGKKKIVEKLITWTGPNPTTIEWNMYDADEVLLVTVTDTISYTGVFETHRTRAIT
jgi:hypothetical protein